MKHSDEWVWLHKQWYEKLKTFIKCPYFLCHMFMRHIKRDPICKKTPESDSIGPTIRTEGRLLSMLQHDSKKPGARRKAGVRLFLLTDHA